MSKRIYLIPDTNVLIQCLLLADIPWRDEFPEAEEIIVVIITPVQREIDRQKGGQGRVGKRARLINSHIRRLIEASEISLSNEGRTPSVKLVSGHEFRPDLDMLPSLDYSHPDDAIVGTVSTFCKAHPDGTVKLLSNDTGVLLTSRRVDVPFHRVPDDWLLPAESNEDQKKMRALEAEIVRLKSNEPKCIIEPESIIWRFTVERYEPLTEAQIQSLLLKLKQQFPEETDFSASENSTGDVGFGAHRLLARIGREKYFPSTEDEIVNYQCELYPQWIASCEAHLRDIHHKLEKRRSAPRILVNLRNDGSRPAEDVRVSFSMRGGGLLIQLPSEGGGQSNDDSSEEQQASDRSHTWDAYLPSPPAAPKGHWKKVHPFDEADRIWALSRRAQEMISPGIGSMLPKLKPHEPDKFRWIENSRLRSPRSSAELVCQQWRHLSAPEAIEFELAWLDGIKSRKGALHVEIHAANLADPVTMVLPVEVVAEVGDTLEEAQELVDILKGRSIFLV